MKTSSYYIPKRPRDTACCEHRPVDHATASCDSGSGLPCVLRPVGGGCSLCDCESFRHPSDVPRYVQVYIPPELDKERHAIKRFFDAMVYKLRLNAHKSGFDSADVETCLARISDEVNELRVAIDEGNVIEILQESADCANFALIAATAAVERGTNE